MLSGEMIQVIVMSGVTGAVIASGSIFAFLKKKKVDIPKVISMVEQTTDVATPVIDLAKKIAPNNPIVNIAELIKDWAKTGAKNAEQLYYSSQLTDGQERLNIAKNTVYVVLKEYGIEPNENQEKIINDTVEAAVNDLGHNKTEAEKQAQLQELQTQNQLLQQENANLKSTITQFTTNAANIIQPAVKDTETVA